MASMRELNSHLYHSASFDILAQRRYGWHMICVFPVTYIVSLTTCLTPWMGWPKFHYRVELLLIVLLTFTGYKIWVSSALPKVAYPTKLDLYLNLTLSVILLFWVVESLILHYVCPHVEDGTSCSDYDAVVGLVFFVGWTLLHSVLFFHTRRRHTDDVPYPASRHFKTCRLHRPWAQVLSNQLGDRHQQERLTRLSTHTANAQGQPSGVSNRSSL